MSARRLIATVLVSLCASGTGLLLWSAPALASSPPVVAEESVSNVAGSSATLEARIDPEGSETTYRFEYGTSQAYGESIPTPEGSAGPGTSAVGVQAHPQDLKSHTTYHYRVLATNAAETVTGSDQTFTTQPAGGELTLPDGRQWELVSPPVKDGAEITAEGRGPVQAATNGDAVTYVATAPIESNAPSNPIETQVVSRRVAGGWSSRDISVPQIERTGTTSRPEYLFFSSDLSLGVAEPFVKVSLLPSEPAVYSTVYIHDNVGGGYTPVITAADVLPGTEKNGAPVLFDGATPDMSHVFVQSESALTSPPVSVPQEYGLYEWAGGHLQLVSITPESEGGEPTVGALASTGIANERALSGIPASTSSDGSRVVWFGAGLFMRDMAKGETVKLSAVQGGSGTGGGRLRFQSESSDGSRVFFSTDRRLTADSSPEGEDLYECAMIEVTGKLACKLTDLTVGENAGENAEFEASMGASKDGSYIYFVAKGVLAHNALGVEPGYHLYVSHNGTTTYITTLAPEDEEWLALINFNELVRRGRVSPNGRYVAFSSERSLTGYDNRDATSGEPDRELYLYDAESNHLVCASCNPTGARPVGAVRVGNREQHYISDGGQLFFGSPEALVPQDTNGQSDVYEYEPAGVGDCTTSSVTFGEASGGCVGLISSGSSDRESTFFDASASAEDVFFATDGRLAPQDFDAAFDVYDAHICSAAVPCSPVAAVAPACTTADACRAAPAPQPGVFGAPASATFSGSGNLAPSVVKPTSPKKTKAKPKRRARKHRKRKKTRKSTATKSLSARTRR
jgi:WD40-like Beta Propeller Repeat